MALTTDPDAGRPGDAPAERPSASEADRRPATEFLDRLDDELRRDRTPADAAPEVLYVVDLQASCTHGGLVIQLMTRRRNPYRVWVTEALTPSAILPACANPDDRMIVAALAGAAGASSPAGRFRDAPGRGHSTFLVGDALAVELLPSIARSGRAFTRADERASDLDPLRWDDDPEPWTFRPEVRTTPDSYFVGGAFERPGDRLSVDEAALALPAGFLIARNRVSHLQRVERPALLKALRATGPAEVPHEHTARLAHALDRAGVAPADLPGELGGHDHEIDVEPRPRLHLASNRWTNVGTLDAAVTFDYDGSIVTAANEPKTFDAARRRIVRRRLTAERDFVDQLMAAGFQQVPRRDEDVALRIETQELASVLDNLLAKGWRIEGPGVRYARASGMHMTVTSGADGFDLTADVSFGDTSVPITGILDALREPPHVVRLSDDVIGLLPALWPRRYAPLAGAAEIDGDRLRFRRRQAGLLDALLERRAADAALTVDDEFERTRQELASFKGIRPLPPPRSFHGELRPYQCEGLGWFQFLRRMGLGGCLADDMGLGKTVMVLALLLWWRDARARDAAGRRPSLVVVPRSLVRNWMAEAARFTPSLVTLDYSQSGRSVGPARLDDYDVVFATYGTLRRDVALKDTEFEYVILDEAQAIKNARSASAKAARLLRGRHRLALSGTPIENHLDELWSLIEFLNPGLLGHGRALARGRHRAVGDADTAAVSRAVRPFILRRTKARVARDLPARTEQTIRCDLAKSERDFYDALRRHYRDTLLARLDDVGLARSKIHVLEALLRLRQAACHTGLVDDGRRAESSSKFDIVVPRLEEVAAEGHKALVFSQFTTLLGFLKARLDRSRVGYEYLDGRTSNRDERVQRFQEDPRCALFLISLKAGGVGLNLTAAEYVFLLDPWWNPAVEAQAISRAHRIGQRREVFAYRVIASDTVEDKILELQNTKRILADAVIAEDAAALRNLRREDLELLLS